MKPIVLGLALVFASATAATIAAQQAQPPSEPAHKIYVLSGCLGGSPSSTAPFKLTGAVAVGQAPVAGAASTTGKDGYELLPVAGVTEQGVAREELQLHIGKKVEVTVRPVEVAAPAKSSSSPATPSTPKPEEPPQRYTVTKIKALAPSCS
jgi:hypothetical protein